MSDIDPTQKPFEHSPESPLNEPELYYSLALEEVHKMQDLAARHDFTLAAEGLEGTRRMLIHEDSLSGSLPLAHVRFGLQPEVRNEPIEGAEELIVRVPMVPTVTASEALRSQLGDAKPALLQGVRVPTKDVAVEVLAGGAVTQHFLVTPDGLRAYDNPADVVESLSELQAGERLLEVVANDKTAAAQARLEAGGMSLSGLVRALTMYELAPQANTQPGRSGAA